VKEEEEEEEEEEEKNVMSVNSITEAISNHQ
jgi:hypothetical protein